MYYILQENCSKSRRFLGLRPRPRWRSLRRSLRPPSRNGLLAFGNRSFAPSALAISPTRTYSLVYTAIYTSTSTPWFHNFRLSYLPPNLVALATPLTMLRLTPQQTKSPSYVAVFFTTLSVSLVLFLFLNLSKPSFADLRLFIQ